MDKCLLVTGGAGFIGSHFIDLALNNGYKIVCLDSLSYASNMANLQHASKNSNFFFVQGNIGDAPLIKNLLTTREITGVVNFAAESHVDNSIQGPEIFVQTNVMGTFHLLWESLNYWRTKKPEHFRFLHVSTDEVFGSLDLDSTAKFSETTPYAPSSPYSATKAASDHLVTAWHRTYGLPVVITNCSNNYGPRQHCEKLIPKIITYALANKPLPVYGEGKNVRDWIYVTDHCNGVLAAFEKGNIGESYCLGGNTEVKNIDLVNKICTVLDELVPRADHGKYNELIRFVTDRPGHDHRYAIDDSKARAALKYKTPAPIEENLRTTIRWYLDEKSDALLE